MIAAQFVVAGISRQQTILDLCAAPGGKTTYMAQIAPKHTFIAVDRSKTRLEKIQQHLIQLDLSNVKLVHNTVSQFVQTHPNMKVKRILLDPPCSALGLRPRLSCNIDSKSILSLAKYQLRMLKKASTLLGSSGYLVYSTCTITHEENEGNIKLLMDENRYEEPVVLPLDELKNNTVEEILMKYKNGVTLRFDPTIHGTPGYFIAVLKKKK